MFYSQLILAKKGPLGQVWLAAHWDKKLTKATITAADVGQAADSIANPVVPLALRVSGHLLLGVTRIYSRKVNYLFTDCSEALVKIKMAFRPGVVDMPEQQVVANPSSINVSSFGEFDVHVPYDIHTLVTPTLTEWMTTPSQTQARRQDITLADTSSQRYKDDSFSGQDSFEDSFGGGDWQAFDIDGNQDLDTSTISDIERARDDNSGIIAPQDTSMLDGATEFAKTDDVDMFEDDKDIDMNAQMEVPDIDMEADQQEDPYADHGIDVAPPSPQNKSTISIDFVIEEDAAQVPTSQDNTARERKQRKRKIGRDSMTELSSAVIKKGLKDASDILRVREPAAKRMKLHTGDLQDLFTKPSTVCLSNSLLDMFKVTMKNGKIPTIENATEKKSNDKDDEEPVERMRRQSTLNVQTYAEDEDDLAPNNKQTRDSDKDDEDFDFGGGDHMDPINADNGLDYEEDRLQEEEELEDVNHGFDLDLTLAPVNDLQANLGDAQQEESTGYTTPTTTTATDHKWHPHTVKVLKVLRKSLEDKETVSYNALAKTTRSRRTAAALFFEMLQLKTLDFIDVKQTKAYGNIQISKTARFMENVPAVNEDGEL